MYVNNKYIWQDYTYVHDIYNIQFGNMGSYDILKLSNFLGSG